MFLRIPGVFAPDEEVDEEPDAEDNAGVEGGCEEGCCLPLLTLHGPVESARVVARHLANKRTVLELINQSEDSIIID